MGDFETGLEALKTLLDEQLTLASLIDVTITTPADNEVLAFDNGLSEWINQTHAEAGISSVGHTHVEADITDLQSYSLTTHTHLLAVGATDVTITAANLNILDNGADTTLHFHASDRARANHTGTQAHTTISDFDAGVQTNRLDQMAAPTASIVFNSQKGTGVLDPTLAQDIATKNYVDTTVASNVTLIGDYNAATNTPDLDTSPSGINEGDHYVVTVAGVFFAANVEAGDSLIAKQANPTLESHWIITQTNLDAASVKVLYESNADTNEFDDAEQSKLAGIETAATIDQTGAEIKTLYEAEANAFTDAQFTKLAGIATGANLYVHPNHTGDVTSVADGATTISALAVTNAMLAGSIANTKLATNPLARANHTGTQAHTTISDFDAGVQTNVLDSLAAPTGALDINSQNLNNILNADIEGYIDMIEISTPANPSANIGRLYVKDAATVTILYFRDSAGVETDLINVAGGGLADIVDDLSPQLGADLDANGFDIQLDAANTISFDGITATQTLVGGAGGITINLPTADELTITINSVIEYTFDSTTADFLSNTLTNVGQIDIDATGQLFFDAGGDTFIQEDAADSLLVQVGGEAGLRLIEIGTEINVIAGANNALATAATDGFLYIPSMAGTPTGNSTDYTGKFSIVWDSSNSKLYLNTATTTWLEIGLTDLVTDLSPQLGANLASNGFDIIFADNDAALFGTGSDASIDYNGTDLIIDPKVVGSGEININTSNIAAIQATHYTQNTITYNATLAFDFDTNEKNQLTLTGVLSTLTTSSRAAGKSQQVFIVADSVDRVLTFNTSWKTNPGDATVTVLANTFGVLSLYCRGTAETDVFAVYAPFS